MNEVTVFRPRLPMPQGLAIDPGQWRVLTDAIFPNARTPEGIMLAIDYCRSRNLDIMKRPVHVVPIWSAALGREVESVWPSITEIEITASRSGQWAGMDKPEFGPDRTEIFRGRRKVKGNWENAEVEITFPEWVSVTVYRLVGGQRCAFCEPMFWIENYGRSGTLPTDQWIKRPRGMAIKVAKAFSLRAAFPEEADQTAEEMEGVLTEPPPPVPPAPKWSGPQGAPKSPPEGGSDPGPTIPPGPAEAPGGPPEPKPEAHVRSHESHAAPEADPETGEVGPRDLAPAGSEDGSHWREWATTFVATIENAKDLEEITGWTEKNQEHLHDLKEVAPKMHARLHAAIGRRQAALAAGVTPDPTFSSGLTP